jgi:dolichol-phosphate mannosyltransferase
VTGHLDLSIVIPTFNERHNVVPLLRRIGRAVHHIPHEILVVDDDSPDGTAQCAAAYAREHPTVGIVPRIGRRGLASAIQEGIDVSRGIAVAWLDADLSMPPETIPTLYAALDRADFVVASRYVGGGADERHDVPVHRLSSRLLNAWLRLLLGREVTDYTSGFVCAKRALLAQLRLQGQHGEYCIDLLHRAKKQGCTITEVPYRNGARHSGESKTATTLGQLLRRGRRYVMTGLRLVAQHGR